LRNLRKQTNSPSYDQPFSYDQPCKATSLPARASSVSQTATCDTPEAIALRRTK
jgi:hypothetical protein